MNCSNPVRINFYNNKFNLQGIKTKTLLDYPEGLVVPCGKCLFCRIQKRKEWSIRMLHELEAHDDSCFLTLTYSDSFLPDNNSLKKSDLQLFIKRLRKNLDGRRIKYFACGEYGPNSNRPHYHAIVYGLSLKRSDKQIVKDSWKYCDWTNPAICRGSFGLAEPNSIRYVANYITKKWSGGLADEEYFGKQRDPVFRILSRGIGAGYCDRFSTQLKDTGYITVNGVKHSIPRYYLKRLGIDAKELNSIKAYENECNVMHNKIGLDISYDEAYMYLMPDEVIKYEDEIRKSKMQNQATLQAKASLYEPKL